MNPIEHILQQNGALILDGALGTELEKLGCDLTDALWSAKVLMEQPERIQQVHLAYYQAGADVAITASYQATVEGFMKRGLSEEEAIALIQKSVRLAQETRDAFWADPTTHQSHRPKPLVAASVGPYGAYLADGSEYRGDYSLSEDELVAFHRPRMKALADAAPDLFACETIPNLVEARALVRVLAEFPDMVAWMSFSAKDGEQISSGESIVEVAKWAEQQPQLAAIGINCTAPQHVANLVAQLKAHTSKPILVYPNTGESYDATEKIWHGDSDDTDFNCSAKQWHANGARLIGGCCRTSPSDIHNIKEWIRNA